MPSGQAQKEVYVNEAFSLLDGVTHCAVEAESNSPAASPADGQAWLIGSSPTGDWSGKAGHLALRQAGQWLYVAPRDGMRVLNRATGQDVRRVAGTWRAVAAPAAASGGTVVDVEARSALATLIARLRDAGIFPA